MTVRKSIPPVISCKGSLNKMALVAEGGGQRGIFTAGVLDAWLANNFDPFDLFIGTSSGSQNITSFLSRQKGYARRLICELSCNKRFYQLGRGLMGGNAVDLDWYFDNTIQGGFALDFEAARKSLGQRELLIPTTNAKNRQSYFLQPNGDNNYWRQLLKASSALPFLYRQGVNLGPLLTTSSINKAAPVDELLPGDFYLDGGLSAPLPVQKAYQRGARKIVVIRTVNADFHSATNWVHTLISWIYDSGHYPKYIDYVTQNEQAYMQELDFIANPPDDVQIIQIFAGDNLKSKLLNSTDAELQHDYDVGIDAGNVFMLTQKAFYQAQSMY